MKLPAYAVLTPSTERPPTYRMPVHEYELMHDHGGNRTSPWFSGANRKVFDEHRSMPLVVSLAVMLVGGKIILTFDHQRTDP